MASWAKRTGNELLKVEEGGGAFTFYIKKTALGEKPRQTRK
jgi:TusA-related sulfurtransferase